MTDAIATCRNCGRGIGRLEKTFEFQGRTVCAQCLRRLSEEAAADRMAQAKSPPEETLLVAHPSMFGMHPVWFTLGIVLFVVVIGIVILLVLWILTRQASFTVTNKRIILNRGILSKFTNEALHRHIRNVQVSQTFFQRLAGVGSIAISTDTQSEDDIVFAGLQDPQEVRKLIDQWRGL